MAKLYIDSKKYMTVKTGNCSHAGAREYQEDSFGYSNIIDSSVITAKGFAAVLADGMGGLSNGRAISDYVVSSFIKMFDALDYSVPFSPQLQSISAKINAEVCRNFSTYGKSEAGSTLAAAFVFATKLYWVCIGDSRLYVLRNKRLFAVNEDHDYFNQLLSDFMMKKMSMEQIKADVQKDTLTSYIGNEQLPFIDSNKTGFPIQNGDRLVLCSDGVYNALSDDEMVDILRRDEPQTASEKISQAVLNKNIAGQDNLTVMVIAFQ
jgi:protein phosphatase